jgi:hypothetical protein
MKIFSIILLLSLLEITNNRIWKAEHMKRNKREVNSRKMLLKMGNSKVKKNQKKTGKYKNKQPRKTETVKYSIFSLEKKMNGNLSTIKTSYQNIIEGNKNDKNEDFKKILKSLELSSKLLMIYINSYILTPKILKDYDHYMSHHKKQQKDGEEDIIKYLIYNLKAVKIRKNEKDFFEVVKKFWNLLKVNGSKFKKLTKDEIKQKNIKTKIMNTIRLVNFINKYIFYVEHLKQDFHYLDYDEDAESDSHHIDEAHYKMKHKNFEAKHEIPDEIPITIVFGNEDQTKGNNKNDEENNYIQNKMAELGQNSETEDHQVNLVENNFEQKVIEENKNLEMTVDGEKEIFDLPDPKDSLNENHNKEEIVKFKPADKNSFKPDDSDENEEDINQQTKLVDEVLHEENHSEIDKLDNFEIKDNKINPFLNTIQTYESNPALQDIDEKVPKIDPEEMQKYIYQKLNINPNIIDPKNVEDYQEEHNPHNIEIIQTPSVVKIDTNPKTIIKYDYGYGNDQRTRLSNREDFASTKNNDNYQDLYQSFRTVSQLPYQQLKEEIQNANGPDKRNLELNPALSLQNQNQLNRNNLPINNFNMNLNQNNLPQMNYYSPPVMMNNPASNMSLSANNINQKDDYDPAFESLKNSVLRAGKLQDFNSYLNKGYPPYDRNLLSNNNTIPPLLNNNSIKEEKKQSKSMIIQNRVSNMIKSTKDRSLFQGDKKKNKWEQKADKVFRKLLNGKL